MMYGFIEFENGRSHQPASDPVAAAWSEAWPHITHLLEATYRLNEIQGDYDATLHETRGVTFMRGGKKHGRDMDANGNPIMDEADYQRRCDELMAPVRERREAAISEVNKHYRNVDAIMQPALPKA
jgi:hypothetical protein